MPPPTKPQWILAPGIWWLDAVVEGVTRPALSVAVISDSAAEIHVVRGSQSANFVTWRGTNYSANGSPSATRAKADAIWQFVVDNYDIVFDGTYVYNGLRAYSADWPDNGRIGGET